jgi:hypothetical protein
MSNDIGPAEEIPQDGWRDVEPVRISAGCDISMNGV